MLSQNNSSSVISSVEEHTVFKNLISSAKAGDSIAFEELYHKLYTPLYRYVISKCQDGNLSKHFLISINPLIGMNLRNLHLHISLRLQNDFLLIIIKKRPSLLLMKHS
jgi:hypothetical protein